jgi:DNA polymerase
MTHEGEHPGAGELLRQTVDGVIEMLNHEKEEGRTTVEVRPEAVRALGQTAPTPAPQPAAAAAREASGPGEAGSLDAIAERIASCTRCGLCEARTRTVPGQGAARPEVMFIGEGPGADEDRQGLAFVGRAGQLLTKIVEAMGFTRDEVWIGNIVKCRPPGNRVPTEAEMEACLPYLRAQIGLLRPRIMVCLGATAVKGLLGLTGITRLRGQWRSFEGIDVMPTFHPAYLLRNPAGKKDVWEDMKTVLKRLGREPPPRKR